MLKDCHDNLYDIDKVYLNEYNENSEDIESHAACFVLPYPLGTHKIENRKSRLTQKESLL